MSEDVAGTEEQFGLDLGETHTTQVFQPNLDELREDLQAILESARNATADTLWDQRTLRYNKVIFPNVARWLPDEEAAQLRFAFDREVERIESLMAA